MRPILVVIGGQRVKERFLSHGSELPPGVLTESEIAQMLDQGRLEETGRRSHYRLFPMFAGSTV